MNKNELAKMLLMWSDLNDQMKDIEDQIKEVVLELEETVTAGEVRATYNAGRRTWDYEQGVKMFMPDDSALEVAVDLRTKVIRKIDWRGICYDENIEKDDIPYSQADPSVTIRRVE